MLPRSVGARIVSARANGTAILRAAGQTEIVAARTHAARSTTATGNRLTLQRGHSFRRTHSTTSSTTTASSSSSSSSAAASGHGGVYLLAVVLSGGVTWLTLHSSDATAHAAEGDSAKTAYDLDMPHQKDRFEESLQYNSDGDIEWVSNSTRPRIVVLGTGWGSVNFLKNLDVNKYEIVVISPRNYFLFTPLLPSACTGTLELGSLTEPIRQILAQRHQSQQSYIEAKAVGLDRDRRKVMCVDSNGRSFLVEYDHLLIGVGANNNTFNTPGVKDYALFLKEAKHARIIRKNILDHFERAASPTTTVTEKQALLQFVIVGGGPTGVEFAGELVDFIDSDLKKQFPSLIPLVRVRLIQSQDHILNTYDEAVSRYAEQKFKQMRIEVITGARVKGITENTLSYEDKETKKKVTIPFGLCLWSTGIAMNDFTKSVAATVPGQESERALVTDCFLRLLREIPTLDRVPKRIVQEAAKVVSADASVTSKSAPQPPQAGAAAPCPNPALHAAIPDTPLPQEELSVDPRVYSFGDCATTYVPKLSKRMRPIFAAADVNGDGKLSYEELRNLCAAISAKVPVMAAQMALIMSRHTLYTYEHRELDLDQFKKILADADKNVRVYPATAQVASQQGKYLAQRFNSFADQKCLEANPDAEAEVVGTPCAKGVPQRKAHPAIHANYQDKSDPLTVPFRYRHMGSLAYIGGETAAIDLGRAGAFTGSAAFWLWKSAYLSEAVSLRTRLNLSWDWCKTWFFGRDTSKP